MAAAVFGQGMNKLAMIIMNCGLWQSGEAKVLVPP